jgi:hypothetical protein
MAETAVTVQLGNTDKMAVTVKQDKTAKQELKVKTLFMMRRENSDETTFTNFAIKGPVGASGTSGKDGTDGQGINLILHYRRKHAWPFLTQKKNTYFKRWRSRCSWSTRNCWR